MLTDDINSLNRLFFAGGIFPPVGASIDTILIQTDSIIYIPGGLSLGANLKNIPENITKIRTQRLSFRSANITTLSTKIMELTSPPFPFDTFYIDISGNSIDTPQ